MKLEAMLVVAYDLNARVEKYGRGMNTLGK